MILWYATRTGRRLHIATIGSNHRTICNRDAVHLICSAIPGRDNTRHQDGRPTCQDCARVARQIGEAAVPQDQARKVTP